MLLNGIRNRVATDPQTRAAMASMFGDPEVRTEVEDSGGVLPAIAKMVGAGGSQPPAPAAPTEYNASDMPASMAAPATPPAPMGAPAAPSSMSSFYNAPMPMSRDEYTKQNPVPVPARPTVDTDSWSGKKNALHAMFLGLQELGGGLAGHPGLGMQAAEQFIGRDDRQRQAQREYDTTQPTLKRTSEEQAYNNYLGQQSHIAGIGRENFQMNQAMAAKRAALLTQYSGELEKRDDKQAVTAKYQRIARAEGIPFDPDEVGNVKTTGSHWEIMKGEGGRPIGLREIHEGTQYGPGQIGDAASKDPQAKTLWDAAVAGHQQEVKDKLNQAAASAQYRGAFQYKEIKNNKTGLGAWVPAEQAAAMTAPGGEWSSADTDVAKAKQRYAQFKDINTAAVNMTGSLPSAVLPTGTIARLESAINENHGIVPAAVRSAIVKGLTPEQADLAANFLALRDKAMELPSILGIPISDSRTQAIYNALPQPSDLSNPRLAASKMKRFHQQISNLQEGLIGDSQTFGIEQPGAAHADTTNTFGEFMKGNKTHGTSSSQMGR